MLEVAQQTATAANKKIYIGMYFIFILFSFLRRCCDHCAVRFLRDVNTGQRHPPYKWSLF
jgi:hypothetical protein